MQMNFLNCIEVVVQFPCGSRKFVAYLEAIGLEVTDANGDHLEVGRAKRGSDVRSLRELVVDRALQNELRNIFACRAQRREYSGVIPATE